ncbi:CU044_5270 family protein [Thermomonospora umbrina]|uniref:CU044_5270 family protein n=1 Tax=Thermomonospora umbrina TaxID=111806 RepID=A0A3D9SQW4_9ACTN|nr:CU044_5270 family protein [Thermomonospora umbrina]REE98329.1 hypothetical protein DFJ69_3816 [Thermomonospora umbrina]
MKDLFPPPAREMPAGRLDARRAHLMAEMDGRVRRPRRLVVGGLVATGLAGAVAAAVIVPGDATAPRPDGPPSAALDDARVVLVRAAEAAAARPDVRPRPDQFIYWESKGSRLELSADSVTRKFTAKRGPMIGRNEWLSVSGKRAGLLRESGDRARWLCDQDPELRGYSDVVKDVNRPPTGCEGVPAYRPNVPTDARRMRDWIYREAQGGNSRDGAAFTKVGDMLRGNYLSPAMLAAMFRAAATIPGVTVTRDVVDLAGRKGIGIGRTERGMREELILDERTYELRGTRGVLTEDTAMTRRSGFGGFKPGEVLSSWAILKVAIVDEVDQRS